MLTLTILFFIFIHFNKFESCMVILCGGMYKDGVPVTPPRRMADRKKWNMSKYFGCKTLSMSYIIQLNRFIY